MDSVSTPKVFSLGTRLAVIQVCAPRRRDERNKLPYLARQSRVSPLVLPNEVVYIRTKVQRSSLLWYKRS